MKNDELKDEFENYPMNVQAAVNWWFSCLTGEEIKYDNGDQTRNLNTFEKSKSLKPL